MRLTDVYIESVGLYLPDPMPLADALDRDLISANEFQDWDWTGVAVAGDIAPSRMGVLAGEDALESSRYSARDIGFLAHAGSTLQGAHGWPVHHYLQRHLAADEATAFRVDQACAGGMLAMQLAATHLMGDPTITAAMVTGADNHFWFDRFEWVRQQRARGGMGILKGDAAHAVILSREGGIARIRSMVNRANPDAEELLRLPGNQFPVPTRVPTPEEWDRIASYDRPAQWLRALGIKTARAAHDCVHQALTDAELTADDVAVFVPILGPRSPLTDFILRRLPMPECAPLVEFGCSTGHLTVNDHVVALTWLRENRLVTRGDNVVLVGNGQQTTISSMVAQIT